MSAPDPDDLPAPSKTTGVFEAPDRTAARVALAWKTCLLLSGLLLVPPLLLVAASAVTEDHGHPPAIILAPIYLIWGTALLGPFIAGAAFIVARRGGGVGRPTRRAWAWLLATFFACATGYVWFWLAGHLQR